MGPMVADRRFGSCGARPTGCGWWFTGRRVAAADDPVIGHPRTLLIFLGAEVCACVQPAKTWSTWVLVAAAGWRRWCAGRPRRRRDFGHGGHDQQLRLQAVARWPAGPGPVN